MTEHQDIEKLKRVLLNMLNLVVVLVIILIVTIMAIPVMVYYFNRPTLPSVGVGEHSVKKEAAAAVAYWIAPDVDTIADVARKAQIAYGKNLIAHTAEYLGPKGKVAALSNGMNCQNCHLDAGTKVFGNNYGSVAATYPKFRARSGTVENIYKRVNDCFERSLNGRALDTTSTEMQAIVAYIQFLGSQVPKGEKAAGSGFKDLAYLDRAADPAKGKKVYVEKCQSCHLPTGEGILTAEKTAYTYPPLWGKHSYNDGAGLYRLSNFAKFVKYNMPFGASHEQTQLTDEEAWDVAAFVNGQPRPHLNVPQDWPDISKKPIDHPFAPYADTFSEQQHKLGPFKPIIAAQAAKDKK